MVYRLMERMQYKKLIFPDFDDVLEDPVRYEHLLSLLSIFFQKSPCTTCNRGSKVAELPPSKFGQCLEIDDRSLQLKFGDVT